ncbi:MAG: acyl-ACP--UDP-N-acetylglucosamine O-acyltransferase [Verrucomicrobiota bacterium]
MIHPTAIIDPAAELADDVEVGPFAIIEGGVKVAAGCKIAGHAQLLNSVSISENCQIHQAAIIGGNPQDLKFDPATPSSVEVGPDCVLREHVTINRGSVEGGVTRLGASNYFMAGAHAGHDASLGDHNILANGVMLGGWVQLGNRIFLGGGAGVHQFVRIGDLCIAQGVSAISMDLPPYTLSAGINNVRGLNSIGLKRSGLDAATRKDIKRAFDLFYRSGKNFSEALEESGSCEWTPEAEKFFGFVRGPSKKGICPYRGG